VNHVRLLGSIEKMNRAVALVSGGVLAIVLALFFLKSIVFGYRYVYEYEFGALGSDLAHFWAGPFTKASFGTSEFGRGAANPLPDLYVHLPDMKPVKLSGLTEEFFVARFGKTSRRRIHGQHRGTVGDAEFGFQDGRLKHMTYFYKVGGPCFSKKADTKRYCFPLSTSDAKELFGKPKDWGRREAPFI
jgi:hypothetical protein